MSRRRRVVLGVAAATVAVVGVVVLRGSLTAAGGADSSETPPPESASTLAPVHEAEPTISGQGAAADEASAVTTALELVAAAQDWLYLSDADLEAAVREVAAPASADRLVEKTLGEVGLARDALARSPGRVWWVVSPLAWRVDTFTSGRAQVSVWAVSVLSASDVAMPQSDWTTTVLDLEWDGTAWRLVSSLDAPGPTPQLGGRDEAWEPEPFDEVLAGFTRVGSEEAS